MTLQSQQNTHSQGIQAHFLILCWHVQKNKKHNLLSFTFELTMKSSIILNLSMYLIIHKFFLCQQNKDVQVPPHGCLVEFSPIDSTAEEICAQTEINPV